MKELERVIKTFYLDRVKTSLAQLGVADLAISEAPSLPRPAASRAGLSTADFLPRVTVRVLAPDHIADQVAAVLAGAV